MALFWLLIGVLSLAVVLALRRFPPVLPGSLVAVLASIAAVALWDLDGHGVDVVGPIQLGLPHLGLPDGGRWRRRSPPSAAGRRETVW
jgi:MFS superfamily sulfate permease-like transporter